MKHKYSDSISNIKLKQLLSLIIIIIVLGSTSIASSGVLISKDDLESNYKITATIVNPKQNKTNMTSIEFDNNYFTNSSTKSSNSNAAAKVPIKEKNYSLRIDVAGLGFTEPSGSKTLPNGAKVRLQATPQAGWVFAGWSGAFAGSENPATLTMDGNKTVTATFTPIQYHPTVTVSGQGSVVMNSSQQTYDYGSIIQLTGVPTSGWQFDHWEVDESEVKENPFTIIIDHDKIIDAVFIEVSLSPSQSANPSSPQPAPSLTPSPTPTLPATTYGITVSVAGQGSVTQSPDQTSYPQGSIVQLTATQEAGWVFAGWSGAFTGEENPATLTMDGNKAVTATFTQSQYTLATSVAGQGAVSKSPSQSSYASGSTVQLTATPASGWVFAGWSGDLSGSSNPVTVMMNVNKAVTATFLEASYSLTISTVGNGHGTVEIDPQQSVYHLGDQVQLYSVSAQGSQFDGWGGDLSGVNNPVTLIIDEDKLITASFSTIVQPTAPVLTIDSPIGSGSTSPVAGDYILGLGDSVQIVATPQTSWVFDHWMLDKVSAGSLNPITVLMDRDHVVRAVFSEVKNTLSIDITGSGTTNPSMGSREYSSYEKVSVQATPSSGYGFNYWRLDGVNVGSVNPIIVDMSVSHSLVAVFTSGRLTLKIGVVGQGSTSPSGTRTYNRNTNVKVVATAADGWIFDHWELDNVAAGTSTQINVIMDSGHGLNAIFSQSQGSYSLSINIAGQGAVSKSPSQSSYASGSTVQLTATPASGWVFSGWSGGLTSTANPATITMDGNKAVTATFTQTLYTVTVATSGQGSVSRSPSQSSYASGSTVQLTATPATGWVFAGWGGGLTSTANPATITMDGNKAVTATFTQTQPPTVLNYPSDTWQRLWYTHSSGAYLGETPNEPNIEFDNNWASGTVAYSMADNVEFHSSRTINLPTTGVYTFILGSDDGIRLWIDDALVIDMWVDRAYAVNSVNVNLASGDHQFRIDYYENVGSSRVSFSYVGPTTPSQPTQFTVTVTTSGQGSVSWSPDQSSYESGTTVQLTATPASGWVFSGWSGDLSGSSNPSTITMNGNKAVTATFTQAQAQPSNDGLYFGSHTKAEVLANPEQYADTIIYVSGSTYYAKAGANGAVTSSGSNARAVIQSAFKNSKIIYLRAGTYIISDNSGISLNGLSDVTIIGASGTILKKAETTAGVVGQVFEVMNSANVYVNGIVFDQDRDSPNHITPSAGVFGATWIVREGNGAGNVWFEGCQFLNGEECGIATGLSTGLHLINCVIDNVGEHPLYLTDTTGIRVDGCQIYNWAKLCRGYAPKVQECVDVSFTNCVWEPNRDGLGSPGSGAWGDYGVYGPVIAACSDLTFTGNVWRETASTPAGIAVDVEPQACSGVSFYGCQWYYFSSNVYDPWGQAVFTSCNFS